MHRRFVFVLASLAACKPVDVSIAVLPDGGEHKPRVCAADVDCQDDGDRDKDDALFCAKDSCDALTGHCERQPGFCENDLAPSCGCNGVTYWNDCLRKQHAIAAATPGEGELAAQHGDAGGGKPCSAHAHPHAFAPSPALQGWVGEG